MKYEKSCGAVVYAMIAGKRHYLIEKMRHGHYAMPKGHVEAGETEAQTAERESLEETGLAVKVDTRFREVTTYSPAPNVTKDVIFFIAKTEKTTTCAQPEEVDRLFFLPFDSALELLTYENDREVMRKAEAYLSK